MKCLISLLIGLSFLVCSAAMAEQHRGYKYRQQSVQRPVAPHRISTYHGYHHRAPRFHHYPVRYYSHPGCFVRPIFSPVISRPVIYTSPIIYRPVFYTPMYQHYVTVQSPYFGVHARW